MWRQDQVEDRDCNESSITRPTTGIKNGVCVRIWIWFSLVIPSMDSLESISLFIFYICFLLLKQSLIITQFPHYPIFHHSSIIFHSIILISLFHHSIISLFIIIYHRILIYIYIYIYIYIFIISFIPYSISLSFHISPKIPSTIIFPYNSISSP